ncbi:DUF4062 domain-containing protein [Lentzea alba]|uniref:DUF4062 domain-containing protein n=1 Tax=Lentzea alba TaxID=2714351 RepID=UPI0039BFBE45
MTGSESEWRRIPLFIASTFRDMDHERDVLTRVVIPAVNAELRRRGHGASIYPVDLRWGIETDERLDPETRQRMILDICVSEVRRCRPLFIGLFGATYGWIPPDALSRAVIDAAGLQDPGFPLSVTAIEFLAAAQAAESDGIQPVLLARRAAATDQGEQERLVRLAVHLVERGQFVHPYDVDTTFTDLATEALLDRLDRMFEAEAPGNWLDAELAEQRWATEREAHQFVGREEELEFIRRFWTYRYGVDSEFGDDPDSPLWKLRQRLGNTTLGIVGSSGCGKSALLAKAATDMSISTLVAREDWAPRAYVQVGATTASERLPVCVLLLLAQLDPEAARSVADRYDAESLELAHVLDLWLQKLAAGRRLFGPLIVVDGLDRLRGSLTESQPLAWLPITWGDRVRVLVSAAEDTFEATLLNVRPATKVLRLGDLNHRDATVLVRSRVAAHHRTIPRAVAERLVSRSKSARWLVVATDLMLTLMAYDYLTLREAQDNDLDPEVALRLMLEETGGQLPPELDGLHEESFARLIDLVGMQVGVVLCLLGASVHGLHEQDLVAALEAAGFTPGSADIALFRAVLAVHVTVRDEVWRFAHPSAATGVDLLLEAASEETGQDVRTAYRRILVRHLATKPVADPARCRELLPLLMLIDEHRLLVSGLAEPAHCTDESVAIFRLALLGFLQGEAPPRLCATLIGAATTDRQRLTIIEIVTGVLPHLRRPDIDELAPVCRAALAAVSPEARNRFGKNADALLHVVDAVSADFFAGDFQSQAIISWFTSAVSSGTGSLRDAPAVPAPATETHARLALFQGTKTLTEYAIMVGTSQLSPADDDAEQAHALLDHWSSFLAGLTEPDLSVQALIELSIAVARRAAGFAWPNAGFQPAVDDFERLRSLTDRMRGEPDLVCLLGLCARVRAAQLLDAMSDEEEITASDTVVIHEALGFLEEAMWQLDIQHELAPDAVAVELTAIQCGLLHSTLLSACDQHVSACDSGFKALRKPHVVDLLGQESFIDQAVALLRSWYLSWSRTDPTPLLERLAQEVDLHSATRQQHPEVDAIMLMVALTAAKRLGAVELATRMVVRALPRFQSGDIPVDDESPLDELVRGFVSEIEDDLVEFVLDEDFPDADDPDLVIRIATGMYEMRTALMAHCPGDPSDAVGALFNAALIATMQRRPDRLANVRAQRQGLTAAADDRSPALLSALDKLLRS